jgi:hypothetical protein
MGLFPVGNYELLPPFPMSSGRREEAAQVCSLPAVQNNLWMPRECKLRSRSQMLAHCTTLASAGPALLLRTSIPSEMEGIEGSPMSPTW